LAPEDDGAVRRGAGSRHSFLGLRHHFPLAPVEVDDSLEVDSCRPLGVGPPLRPPLCPSRLLHRWQEVGPVISPRNDKLLGRYRGSAGRDGEVEAAMRRLAVGSGGNGGRLATGGWIRGEMGGNLTMVTPIVVAHPVFTLCWRPRSPSYGLDVA
jgi:hypothetical protein